MPQEAVADPCSWDLISIGTYFSLSLILIFFVVPCILISSYLENSLRQIILDYAERKCSEQSICTFVNLSLARMRNPSHKYIKDLLKKFDLKIKLENKQREAIESIYTNRNGIAHSKSPRDLSLSRVEEYFETICTVVDAIDQTFNRAPQKISAPPSETA